MKKFIEMRNLTEKSRNPNDFQGLFLENYIKRDKRLNGNKIIRDMERIRNIEHKDILKGSDICEMFEILGRSEHLDRYIVNLVLEYMDESIKSKMEKLIKSSILDEEYNNEMIYHILDICIEVNLDILNEDELLYLLERYKLDYDIIYIIIEYMVKFKKYGLKEKLEEILRGDYPENIKIQIFSLFAQIESGEREKVYEYFKHLGIINDSNRKFYEGYLDYLNGKIIFKGDKLSILQSMFYGDFEDSGKGNNGGLAILLRSLGDEVSKGEDISYVFTITITDKLEKTFISHYGENHIFVRLPIYLNREKSDSFVKKELVIKRGISNFFKRVENAPDIFHIRYLDNASKAVGKLSREWNKKLVLTLAPDPHRNMPSGDENINRWKLEEIIEKLNKIKIGDELIQESDAIVGIGNEKVRKELEKYFPNFKQQIISGKVKMLGEGIRMDSDEDLIDLKDFTKANFIHVDFFKKPIILNVGRLSEQKGQKQLLKAWNNSKLFETHNLLIIGGDLERPNREEMDTIRFFEKFKSENPHMENRFFHKGAMINERVISLQKSIMENTFNYPHVYICSSIKEEFGIAILEAMCQGFLMFAPINGGVKSYLNHSENGFLIDTKNHLSIRKDVEENLYDPEMDREKFNVIQNNGRRSVEELFSIRKIGEKFLEFYLELKEKTDEL